MSSLTQTNGCDSEESLLQDTVGVICVDHSGGVVSAVSSGGIVLKQPGRLGQVRTQIQIEFYSDHSYHTLPKCRLLCEVDYETNKKLLYNIIRNIKVHEMGVNETK